jgi:hypothetical protein
MGTPCPIARRRHELNPYIKQYLCLGISLWLGGLTSEATRGIFFSFILGLPNPLSAELSAIGRGMVSTDHFRQEIRSRFQLASAQGRKELTIECGELYRSVSKLPVFDPWMIFCCNAMRAEMARTDRLIFDDSKTSLLTIRYDILR